MLGKRVKEWSGREDLNFRPQRPERCALADCATPRLENQQDILTIINTGNIITLLCHSATVKKMRFVAGHR